jgi:hypothetical protein
MDTIPTPVPRRPTGPLYRRRGVLVTYDVFESGGRRYRVDGLARLRTARCTRNPVTAWVAVLGGATVAAIGIGLSFGRHPAGPDRTTYAVLLVAAVVPTLVVLLAGRRARRSHELWGDYLGATTLLFASTDEREFGQVTRALLRAREAAVRRR